MAKLRSSRKSSRDSTMESGTYDSSTTSRTSFTEEDDESTYSESSFGDISESELSDASEISPPYRGSMKSASTRTSHKRDETFEGFIRDEQKKKYKSKAQKSRKHRHSSYDSGSAREDVVDSESDTEDERKHASTGVHHHHHHHYSEASRKLEDQQIRSNMAAVATQSGPKSDIVSELKNIGNTMKTQTSQINQSHSISERLSGGLNGSQSAFADASSIQPGGRFSLSNIHNMSTASFSISANNSKAVLSALKSLQNKIKALEEERDELKRALDEEKKAKIELKYEMEQTNLKLQQEVDREKMQISLSKNDYEQQIEIAKQEKKVLKAEFDQRMEQEKQNLSKVNHEWELKIEKLKSMYEQQVKSLEEKHQEISTMYSQSQNKIDELQRNLVKAVRKREKAEGHSSELDRALQDMIALHQDFVKNKSEIDEYLAVKTAEKIASTKKSKKTKRSTSKKKILSRPSSAKRPNSASRPKSADRKRVISPGRFLESRLTNYMGGVRSFVSGSNLHERHKKAALTTDIPFLSGGTDNSYNVTANVQKTLNMANEYERKKVEEPYNYYGSNAVDPLTALMLKQIDEINSSEDLSQVISSLEAEYKSLNDQYTSLLPAAEQQPNQSKEAMNIEVKTDEMRRLLNEMEKKGKMLHFLKLYRTRVSDHIREATSPPRVRGALKRVKALRLIHELRSLQNA